MTDNLAWGPRYHSRPTVIPELLAAAAAKSLQSCPTLWDPTDGSPPGSAVSGILQARTWCGLPFASPMHESEKWKWSRSVMSNLATPWTAAHQAPPSWDFPGKSTGVGCHCLLHFGLYSPWNSPGQNIGVGSLSLLQGIFPTQELNWGLLHCRRILYQQSYHGIMVELNC